MRAALPLLVACTGHTTTIVRMARPGELVGVCAGAGRPDFVTLDPVVELARTYLVQRMDGCARGSDARVYWTVPGVPRPPLPEGTAILVEPRADVGRLEVSIKHGSWYARDEYCLYVREEHGMRTVVVAWTGGLIK